MKERLVPSIVIGAAVLIGSVVVARLGQVDKELVEAVEGIRRELFSVDSAIDRITGRPLEGFEGEAHKVVLTYLNGEQETLQSRHCYIVVQKDHIVIHMPEKGEARNGARKRRLVPFSAVRSIERLREDSP